MQLGGLPKLTLGIYLVALVATLDHPHILWTLLPTPLITLSSRSRPV